MPLVATRGAASAQGFGEFARVTPPIYIEDVFSTWLYTGNGTSQTITNNVNLATYGGLVWTKSRSAATTHRLWDTTGRTGILSTDTTNAENEVGAYPTYVYGLSNGFAVSSVVANTNTSAATYASWTFRKQAKFFDMVTYTGNGANRTIAHNLGSVPGTIIIKRTDTTAAWAVYHRSLANTEYLVLNTTAAKATGATYWNSTTPTSTVFSLGTSTDVNANGGTYVAYLFAHDAGGFGLAGTDNVISCGSFTTDGSGNATVNLGYEPQWILYKDSQSATNWITFDVMRGWALTDGSAQLFPNTSGAENNAGGTNQGYPTATGFVVTGQNPSKTLIYIAIRRGPMKTPTSGTSVFSPVIYTPTANTSLEAGFTVDLNIGAQRNRANQANTVVQDRLRGGSASKGVLLYTNRTDAEFDPGFGTAYDRQTSILDCLFVNYGYNSPTVQWLFRRAPGFFDVVCYTGNNVDGRAISHNLTVKPELVILKTRNSVQNWPTLYDFTGAGGAPNGRVLLNTTGSNLGGALITAANASTITLSTGFNSTPNTYVSYLFASCPGVSKVGSYTGTGALQTINCGFAAGARFVLIKRTDSTGDWYVWDSARGISSSTDPYLTLNTTAAEVTSTNWVDTASTGFQVTAAGGNLVNTNGGTYIFLAIA